MRSIAARLSLATGIVLAAFVLSTALAIQNSVEKRTLSAQYDRLQGLVYGLLGSADVGQSGRLLVDEFALPDASLNQPGATLVAQILDAEGNPVWRSGSLIFDLPSIPAPELGEWSMQRYPTHPDREHFILRFALEWEVNTGETPRFLVQVAQDTASFDRLLRASTPISGRCYWWRLPCSWAFSPWYSGGACAPSGA